MSERSARGVDALKKISNGARVNIKTYGCQQNVSDSERIAGLLSQAGCVLCDDENSADVIIFNTCAVRGHAEDKVLGHIGRLKKLKEQNQRLVIAAGGCMVEQPSTAAHIKQRYPYVDIIFNTNELGKLPELLAKRLAGSGRLFEEEAGEYLTEEGLPIERFSKCRAFISVMLGCDNFCSYCVVPLVRGRERSRRSDDILGEFRECVRNGYKEITLLGQNVNSYGKGLEEDTDFAALLQKLDAVEGDYVIRFMTSHPKDATDRLFETIANSRHISRHIHLPVQSGSDEILKKMNRRYTSEDYLRLVRRAREIIGGVTFTSDIIVGFPGESEEDFKKTCELVQNVGFYSLFIFIYSKRDGTAAAKLLDDTPRELKAKRLMELTKIQDEISAAYDEKLVGTAQRALVTDKISDGVYEARLDNNAVVETAGESDINVFREINITECVRRRLRGAFVG